MIRPHPRQLLLTGGEHGTGPRPPRRNRLAAWARSIERPSTVAELAALWWPEVGDPRALRVGQYGYRWHEALRRAYARVRRMEAAGVVTVALGPLVHRRQAGLVVAVAASASTEGAA